MLGFKHKSMDQRCPELYRVQACPIRWVCCPMFILPRLAGGHGLGDQALQSQLLLLEVLGGGVLDLQLGHGVAESRLDLLLVATLQLHRHTGVRDNLLDTRDVRLQLLAGLELLGESLVAGLELGGVCK